MEVFEDAFETRQIDYEEQEWYDATDLHDTNRVYDFAVNGDTSVLWQSTVR